MLAKTLPAPDYASLVSDLIAIAFAVRDALPYRVRCPDRAAVNGALDLLREARAIAKVCDPRALPAIVGRLVDDALAMLGPYLGAEQAEAAGHAVARRMIEIRVA